MNTIQENLMPFFIDFGSRVTIFYRFVPFYDYFSSSYSGAIKVLRNNIQQGSKLKSETFFPWGKCALCRNPCPRRLVATCKLNQTLFRPRAFTMYIYRYQLKCCLRVTCDDTLFNPILKKYFGFSPRSRLFIYTFFPPSKCALWTFFVYFSYAIIKKY